MKINMFVHSCLCIYISPVYNFICSKKLVIYVYIYNIIQNICTYLFINYMLLIISTYRVLGKGPPYLFSHIYLLYITPPLFCCFSVFFVFSVLSCLILPFVIIAGYYVLTYVPHIIVNFSPMC
jgi:hypothetical protein